LPWASIGSICAPTSDSAEITGTRDGSGLAARRFAASRLNALISDNGPPQDWQRIGDMRRLPLRGTTGG
jgi:hypothetical protein